MRICGGVLLAGLLFFAAPGYGQSHDHGPASVYGSPEEEVSSLAKNIDSAIRLCSEESARTSAHVTAIGKVETKAVGYGILRWIADPPPPLKEMATRNGRTARTGQWFDPHATIWIVADDTRPTCRIIVGGSYWTPQVRPALYAIIQNDHYWQQQGPEKPFQDNALRAEFYASPVGDGKVRPTITIVAPTTPAEGGVQLNIGVHIVSIEEK